MEKILACRSQPQQHVLEQKLLEASEVPHAFSACGETPNGSLIQAQNPHPFREPRTAHCFSGHFQEPSLLAASATKGPEETWILWNQQWDPQQAPLQCADSSSGTTATLIQPHVWDKS